MDVQTVEKSFNCGIYFIGHQNTQSHSEINENHALSFHCSQNCIWNYQRTTAGLGLLPTLNVIEHSTSAKLPSRLKSNQVISSATSWNLKMRTIISRLYSNRYFIIRHMYYLHKGKCASVYEKDVLVWVTSFINKWISMLCCGFSLLHFVVWRTKTLIKEKQSIPRLDKSNTYLILESISWLIHVKEFNHCRKSLTCCATGTTRHKNWAEQQIKRLFLSNAGFLIRIQ